MSLFDAAWVIARRDFLATVYSRSFILFLLVPLVILGAALIVGEAGDDDGKEAQPVVAMIADSDTVRALEASRERLSAGTSENLLPRLRAVDPAENVPIQARRLLADEAKGYSAVLSGTLERPMLTGPLKIDENVGRRVRLIVDDARRVAALESAGGAPPRVELGRDVTAQAAGNLQQLRRDIARATQMLIFMITVLLATLLLSNMAEEKSNKVIEVLAAAVPLDAVFLGKLFAMLGVSVIGLLLWGGAGALAYLFFQVLQDFVTLPDAGPAVGWPLFVLFTLVYYCTNYLLLGALFLGIGGQASNIREIQTLSMPITLLQVFVFFLALRAVGSEGGFAVWAAYLVPFSSPLAMVAFAAQQSALWPHALALVWQLVWIAVIVRISAGLFRRTVLKSGASEPMFRFPGRRKPQA